VATDGGNSVITRIEQEEKNTILYKTSLKEDVIFKRLDLSGTKINTRKTINDVILPIAYNDTLLITNEKKIDLLTLLPLIPEVFHEYY